MLEHDVDDEAHNIHEECDIAQCGCVSAPYVRLYREIIPKAVFSIQQK